MTNKSDKNSAQHGLPAFTIAQLHSVFKNHDKIVKVVLYGSRAMGNYRRGSDIDITLYGEGLTSSDRSHVAGEIDELPIPYRVDVSIFDHIGHAPLRDHIKRHGVIFYEKNPTALGQ